MKREVSLDGLAEHNLKGGTAVIPHGSLTVITGVSGSGKSSLAIDTLLAEGQRRYLETFSSQARRFMAQRRLPALGAADGLLPALAVDQGSVVRTPRSTVGTLTGLYDLLRLLWARLGDLVGDRRCASCGSELGGLGSVGGRAPRAKGRAEILCPSCGAAAPRLEARLFSFNTPMGACPECRGLGVSDGVDPSLLIRDPGLSLRQGALVPTTPSGYIVYSQVTVDVLDQVCRAHGFGVDTPWAELTEEQREVVLRGSGRLKIPFGKHPLESRLRWTGMTAKPRQEGYYKGILTIMEEILAQKRNANILRFVRTRPCKACQGTRIGPDARAVTIAQRHIGEAAGLPLPELGLFLEALPVSERSSEIAAAVRQEMERRISILVRLGLSHLDLSRSSESLSGGEAQRLRLSTQLTSRLSSVLYVLDEPTAGVHPEDVARLLDVVDELREMGNTVVAVEHDPAVMRRADWLVDVGPGAAEAGGEILYCGPSRPFVIGQDGHRAARSPTQAFLAGRESIPTPARRRPGKGELRILGASEHNLAKIDVTFKLGAFIVVTGVSGAGKSTLVNDILGKALRARLQGAQGQAGLHDDILGAEDIEKVISVDQAPIGRSSRSNPATYTKAFDKIREVFAQTPLARQRGWGRGFFSFNTEGGRCETCQGAGELTVGLQHLGETSVPCPACEGRRFGPEALRATYLGASILDVLEMTVEEASALFADHPGILRTLAALSSVGLGYLKLGQSATTLSGGEAQRVKLAAQLERPSRGRTLYILDEPSVGLSLADLKVLLGVLDRLVDAGNTLVSVEHDLDFIRHADWVCDLGPGAGTGGGRLVAAGPPEEVAEATGSFTGAHLRRALEGDSITDRTETRCPPDKASSGELGAGPEEIRLTAVSTHNLKSLDVVIPRGKLVVVTGVSGSGKSSLAMDTLHAEGQRRFAETLKTYARRFVRGHGRARLLDATGLSPAVAARQRRATPSPRSTLGTLTEALTSLRLIYSRAGRAPCPACGAPHGQARCPACQEERGFLVTSSLFSSNSHQGACPACDGLGSRMICDPALLVTDPGLPLAGGALAGSRTGRHHTDPEGKHLAIMRAVARAHGFDIEAPLGELPSEATALLFYGTGAQAHQVEWRFKRGKREGTHVFEAPFPGLCGWIEEEYSRLHADDRGVDMLGVMRRAPCPACQGARLKAEALVFLVDGRSIHETLQLSVEDLARLLEAWKQAPSGHGFDEATLATIEPARAHLLSRCRNLGRVGLGYLSLDRPIDTLSGGEAQRARLSASLLSGLTGLVHVLDEPTFGLHASDTMALIEVLGELRDQGNTVVVVEHDPALWAAADHLIDLGPGAGAAGGEIVAQGSPEELSRVEGSLTARYLRAHLARMEGQRGLAIPKVEPERTGRCEHSAPGAARPLGEGIRILGASAHNLKGIDVEIPSGGLVAVTGVSGSGKSSLALDVLVASSSAGSPVGCREVRGLERFSGVTAIGQQAHLGGATPASALGVEEELRALFSRSTSARELGLPRSAVSWASKAGACPECGGAGRIKVPMVFLEAVTVECPECKGRRYQPGVLECRLEGRSIADVMELRISEAAQAFSDIQKIRGPLAVAMDLGLGYLPLGQETGSLSGGEAQRLRLCQELTRSRAPGSGDEPSGRGRLMVFDEPTAGLHPADVELLLEAFGRLLGQGFSLLVVEHNLSVIEAADWVVDLGPGAGDAGGWILGACPPGELTLNAASRTGQAMRGLSARSAAPEHPR
ncbi:MAG: excinuclease ABC subunit UvrA [Polyangia bacterium]|jgi:excinuclease ABC subunit A|nr:excinuclease ABC subunit UvrA [Polyangia bacterium]